MTKAVIATVAEDRPGLVSELSELVLGLDLNIEDSRMTVLGGEFAVLMSISGSDANLTSLETKLAAQGEAGGFAYLYRRTGDRPEKPRQRLVVNIEAMDHPGIVHRVAAFFSERGVNIAELSTDTERAAHTGAPIFNLNMEIEAPVDESLEALSDAFRTFCDQENLDGRLGESAGV
jgi:glycine cleavage system transcriptional repressor